MTSIIAPDVTKTSMTEDGTLVVERVQDCDPILQDAAVRRQMGEFGSSDFKLAARMPVVLVEKYCNDNGITMAEFMGNTDHARRMLNDPALSHFRVWPGKV